MAIQIEFDMFDCVDKDAPGIKIGDRSLSQERFFYLQDRFET